jgi:hypothetical protein
MISILFLCLVCFSNSGSTVGTFLLRLVGFGVRAVSTFVLLLNVHNHHYKVNVSATLTVAGRSIRSGGLYIVLSDIDIDAADCSFSDK